MTGAKRQKGKEPASNGQSLLDVVIVGGGPAGLSAALILGRSLRTVCVFDAGEPRNAASRASHGFLTRDGMAPAEFLRVGREQLERYETVAFRKIRVTHVERGDGCFTVTLEGGERITSRFLLLATGLVDDLPQVKNFEQFYGVSAHNCPYCDGWEHRGQPIAVIGSDKCAADLALELRFWSDDVFLCTDGGEFSRPASLKLLERNRVQVIRKLISRLEGTRGRLQRILFVDGTSTRCRALFFAPRQRQRSPFAETLGCKVGSDGCVHCDADGSTCIPGVYVVGNASKGVQLIVAAAAEGARAAMAINSALLEADARRGQIRCGATRPREPQ